MQKILVMNEYSLPAKKPTKAYLFCKRTMDIVFSLGMIACLSPVLAALAVIAAIDTHGSPVFVQLRMGRNGKPFHVYKFRTMSVNAPANVATYLLNDAESYISRVGGFLRKSSLDELPQLLNILKGDMSFVGPRPVVLSETDLLELRRRNGAGTVRPGLTGLAQVSGRDDVSIGLKAKLDSDYVEDMCFVTDMRIVAKTFVNVLKSDGVTEGPQPEIASTEVDEEAERKARSVS